MATPNVLILMTDQQSAEAMSFVLGREHLHTPNMDALAASGVVFDRAYTPNPLCAPARASLFTGRYPHEIGLQTNSVPQEPNRFRCLGTYFRDAGFDTAYFGKWHLQFPYADTSLHGFQAVSDTLPANGIDLITPQLAASFIRAKRETPFFLVASFNNPHNICEWARGDRELPDGDVGTPPPLHQCPPLRSNLAETQSEATAVSLAKQAYQANPMFPVGDYGEAQWRELVWAYYRMIELVDQRIGEVLTALHDSGEYDNTIILLLSDHGECRGAHGWNQKTVFYEESTRVPYILNAPGLSPGRSNALVNFGVDTLPTLGELTGVELPQGLPGMSLVNAAHGTATETAEYLVCENKAVQGADIFDQPFAPDGRMVRTARYKYCLYSVGPRYESLFDLEQDPGEMQNLAEDGDYGGVLAEHRKHLSHFAQRYGDDTAEQMLASCGDRS
ncbi:sulfatase family protein [Algisphaera agarilytica]|uniref:Arylsulfatase A-like enzyme n=1 Tax=Algisphaera agarilytica TaxID=1385975 RepID=A0A7X0LLH4_9BACT|nr:sulfatase-like hydrolase/transferase [Algisphaera agarilytica]MBB6431012.1 arylsulfatase A-like enzyme [Algisphaera agarilytica]